MGLDSTGFHGETLKCYPKHCATDDKHNSTSNNQAISQYNIN